MKRDSSYYSLYVVGLGYVLLLILAIVSTSIFFKLEEGYQNSHNEQELLQKKENQLKIMIQGHRNRTLILTQLLSELDPFRLDSLRTQLDKEANQIIQARQKLIDLGVTPRESQLLKHWLELASKNRIKQDRIYDMVLADQQAEAQHQLIYETLPIQEQVKGLLTQLDSLISAQSEQAKQKFNGELKRAKQFWLWSTLLFILGLLIIGITTLRRLEAFQQRQIALNQELAQKVQASSEEIILDSCVLQNTHEALALINADGKIIKTNQVLDGIMTTVGIENATKGTVWQLLHKLFPEFDIDDIQYHLIVQGHWRDIGHLTSAESDRSKYYRITMIKVTPEVLSEHYYSLMMTDVTELKHTQTHLEHLANYDSITQLPNRYLFQRRLQEWIEDRNIKQFSLFYVDLDNFKWINDTHGHSAGDELLREVGQSFEKNLKLGNQCLVARLGGDEFAILSDECNETRLTHAADRILGVIEQFNDKSLFSKALGCSIGVASYPKDGDTVQSLMKHADFAMYKSKEQGKNQYHFFSEEMNRRIHYLYEMERNLQRALHHKQLSVHFQPQYSLNDLSITGAEALVRWQHQGEFISPAEFIPLAEQFGLIHQIGEFVLHEALGQLKAWQKQNRPIQKVAINASSAQLNLGNFSHITEQALQMHRLEPAQLDIEITESILMENLHNNRDALSELQKRGLEISIDDFGTGYSSLSYIKHLDADRIKIDRSFIQDIDSNSESYSIVSAIITMGHSLGIKVLAEGIETPQQLEILRALGCDEGQGYLLSKPVSAKDFPFEPPVIES
ncbi:EAL domain-containing protein [Thiomicrorhabdus sp. zzn3]|uniref:EAL domain-containing protein n=1 Tax=Thiomicrorhabdus sp. zzn3 TaxID=3039775 RepID=UPI0024368345|nr:EAL domain-containing protein [Thiomicrorhabdus sp. zzn3]MDG6777180.1 EAL domain-containing protein [Thiomicrorhabdus sp. zzn3]